MKPPAPPAPPPPRRRSLSSPPSHPPRASPADAPYLTLSPYQALIFLHTVTHQGKAASSSRVDGRAAEKLKGACGVLLKAIPPGGAAFHAEVDALLAREEHWMEWKAAGCTPFEKTP